MINDEDEWMTRVHEAAHAIVSELCGVPIGMLSVGDINATKTAGRVRFPPDQKRTIASWRVILAAGMAAQLYFGDDTRSAMEGAVQDVDFFREVTPDAEFETEFPKAIDAATILIHSYEPAIRALARRLRYEPILCRGDVLETIANHATPAND